MQVWYSVNVSTITVILDFTVRQWCSGTEAGVINNMIPQNIYCPFVTINLPNRAGGAADHVYKEFFFNPSTWILFLK